MQNIDFWQQLLKGFLTINNFPDISGYPPPIIVILTWSDHCCAVSENILCVHGIGLGAEHDKW